MGMSFRVCIRGKKGDQRAIQRNGLIFQVGHAGAHQEGRKLIGAEVGDLGSAGLGEIRALLQSWVQNFRGKIFMLGLLSSLSPQEGRWRQEEQEPCLLFLPHHCNPSSFSPYFMLIRFV